MFVDFGVRACACSRREPNALEQDVQSFFVSIVGVVLFCIYGCHRVSEFSSESLLLSSHIIFVRRKTLI